MSGRLAVRAVAAVCLTAPAATAWAQASAAGPPSVPRLAEEPSHAEREIGARVGVASGGRATPGGLRFDGHYLYQLSELDWFDGAASFTFGGGGAACFRDREDQRQCDHGLASGAAVGFDGTIRRRLGGRQGFWPYVRAGAGARLVRFSDDEVTGLALVAIGGGGVRARLDRSLALLGEAAAELGGAWMSSGLGAQPQFSIAVTVGVEFRLR